jgi:hypothetical protein
MPFALQSPISNEAADAPFRMLCSSLDTCTPTFVLIDPLLGEPPFVIDVDGGVPDVTASREQAWQRHIQPIELHEKVRLAPNLHPYLVLLESVQDPLLEMTFSLAQAERQMAIGDGLQGDGSSAHRIGGWLQSSMQPMQLAELLTAMFRVKTAAQTTATYLRLADRRVLSLLRHIAGDARVASQFGRLQQWLYLDGQGRIDTIRSVSETVSELRLSAREWLHLSHGETVHRASAQWMGELTRRNNEIPHRTASEFFALTLQAVLAAQRAAEKWPYRFPALKDRTTWAALSLLHPEMLHAPYVSKIAEIMHSGQDEDEPAEPLRYLYGEIIGLLESMSVA